MSFSIDIQPISSFKRIRIVDNLNNVHIDIISKGALLNSWWQGPENWDIIDGNHFENGWGDFESNGFKSGKMIPYACRLNLGKYKHDNKEYTIEKFYLGAHGLHGILYDAVYQIVKTSILDDSAAVLLEYNYKGTDKGFPFPFQIQVLWTLHLNNKLTVQTFIKNQSEMAIPMMDGWHPYFKLGENIEDTILQFVHTGMLVYNDELIPTGAFINNTKFDKGAPIANTHLDNGYRLSTQQLNCTLENKQYQLIIKPSEAYPYLQIYTPDNRKSIAIENLSAAPDCFNNKIGLHIMQPQELWELSTCYQLNKK